MTDLVDTQKIEAIVGEPRHPRLHLGSANSEDGKFYILHSSSCVRSGIDLRDCEYSVALDTYGVDFWAVDTALVLQIDAITGDIITEPLEDYDED